MNQALDQHADDAVPSAHARRSLGDALEVFPIALGTNTFGWTSSEDEAHAVLDAYVDGGGNFLDTADVYPAWAEGREGGESEEMIGRWIALHRSPDDLIVASKCGQHPRFSGLAPETVRAAAEASRERLGVRTIDLFYAHLDDPSVPLVETVRAFSELVDAGIIRFIGLSNFAPARVREWLEITDREGFHRPIALQPHYNLMERGIEAELLPVARESGLGVVPYWSLAQGFLTGKYRSDAETGSSASRPSSPRANAASAYVTPLGERVLAALDGISGRLKVEPGAVALAWLMAQPGVVSPIASARTPQQVSLLLDAARITLDPSEVDELTRASSPERPLHEAS